MGTLGLAVSHHERTSQYFARTHNALQHIQRDNCFGITLHLLPTRTRSGGRHVEKRHPQTNRFRRWFPLYHRPGTVLGGPSSWWLLSPMEISIRLVYTDHRSGAYPHLDSLGMEVREVPNGECLQANRWPGADHGTLLIRFRFSRYRLSSSRDNGW